jgi:hypothetical protein
MLPCTRPRFLPVKQDGSELRALARSYKRFGPLFLESTDLSGLQIYLFLHSHDGHFRLSRDARSTNVLEITSEALSSQPSAFSRKRFH